MSKKPCRCLPRDCKRPPKTTDCAKVTDIIEALNYDRRKKQKKKKPPPVPVQFKMKKFVPPHFKDTCVPMVPSMHTRLRYIGHCAPEPPFSKTFIRKDFFDDAEDKKKTRRVCMAQDNLGTISMPRPAAVVRHQHRPNTSILEVSSPKTSGENIRAQRASVKPNLVTAPLPPHSGHTLFKPHSGIILNREKDFCPDAVHGGNAMPPKKRGRPCHKGGICHNASCTKKKCRKFAAMRKKRLGKNKWRGPICPSGVTDGKPRAKKGSMSHLTKYEDDVCGLDEIPNQEYVDMPDIPKHSLKTHSLTALPCTKDRKSNINYGILKGSFNMYDPKYGGKSRGRQALTMSVMAYCLAFHYHPKQWTMRLVDNLVDAGDQWYIQCLEKVHDHAAVQGICEVLPFGKKQTLVLNGKRMQVLLGEPDIIGYTMSTDPTVYNLCRGLKAFFKDNRAGVMLSRVLKLVIWKDKVCYYIFDPAGRDLRGVANFTQGTAVLINVREIEHVADVLLARTVLEDQKYVLAAVKVLKMIDERIDDDFQSDPELTQAEKTQMGFKIMDENSAIVNASFHLGDRCFEDAKFRQALPIAIVAMTYAKISPPNTWFTKTLDKIIRLGNKLYLDCLHPKVLVDMTIDNIPNEIIIGPYSCEIIIYRDRVKGQLFSTKECIFNIMTGLDDFFNHEYNSGILEFNNYSLAVWRQKDMFYLFDPYPRTCDGVRALKSGKACCWMMLNTKTMAERFTKNWDYLPITTQFYIHAFKVLKLKKKEPKMQIKCTLSDSELPGAKNVKRKVLPGSQARGDGERHDDMPDPDWEEKHAPDTKVDEERMGDIVSLVDSIQDDYVPPIPKKYKNMPPEEMLPRVVNLDSPTVSVTQVVPPWPRPRDKSSELPEPDPDPEPTPPPTPPPPPVPEGGIEEEEEEEDEEDEEVIARKKEEAERKKAEEEEARRKAEELPPAMPPPPPSPQPEQEVPLAPMVVQRPVTDDEEGVLSPVNVDRKILLTEDARVRYKLRQMRKKMTTPLAESQMERTVSEELRKPSNFKDLPDNTQIIRGSVAAGEEKALDILPFTAIIAIVTSYKYSIDTWSKNIVNFVVDTAKQLYKNKQEKFQMAPVHIIPKIAIGHQAFYANIDVVGEGATWQLEDILNNKFFPRFDRGMITTAYYSCAFFQRNGLYYLFDGSPCNAMGLRNMADTKGNACFLRFRNLHELINRVLYNKDGKTEDHQFVLSRIIVRRLMRDARMKLPEDHDFETGRPKSSKSKSTIVTEKKTATGLDSKKSDVAVGYQLIDGVYRIEGTTALGSRSASSKVRSCHFVCLVAMLMAAMHPIRTWDQFTIDTCIEKGLEIAEKANNLNVCDKRVIKNVIIDGKFININIKKILVVNDNPDKKLEQYVNAVLKRLRYVIIRFPECSLVLCQTDGYYHIFDPYPPHDNDADAEDRPARKLKQTKPAGKVASWTLHRSIDALIRRLHKLVSSKSANHPEFYTFELTSVKTAPRHSALNYRLSPLFKPDQNPNMPYLKRRKIRSVVDEKMYWLHVETIPWSRMNPCNGLGLPRNIAKTLRKDWDIEFPGDLYSLWGTIHPLDTQFVESHRGKQYLATSVVALAMSQACNIKAWTSGILDGIVKGGDAYHEKIADKIGSKPNVEIDVSDLISSFEVYPFDFSVKFEKIIFGFVYNILPDRFNLSKALSYFFDNYKLGLLVSPSKNLAFGRFEASYFMYDCQSYGAPVYCPGQGASYVLQCESLNRLVYCITLTLNIKKHGQQFHLFNVTVSTKEKSK